MALQDEEGHEQKELRLGDVDRAQLLLLDDIGERKKRNLKKF